MNQERKWRCLRCKAIVSDPDFILSFNDKHRSKYHAQGCLGPLKQIGYFKHGKGILLEK